MKLIRLNYEGMMLPPNGIPKIVAKLLAKKLNTALLLRAWNGHVYYIKSTGSIRIATDKEVHELITMLK
jgi:hypothetical protein